jgi:hypothetical protein
MFIEARPRSPKAPIGAAPFAHAAPTELGRFCGCGAINRPPRWGWEVLALREFTGRASHEFLRQSRGFSLLNGAPSLHLAHKDLARPHLPPSIFTRRTSRNWS